MKLPAFLPTLYIADFFSMSSPLAPRTAYGCCYLQNALHTQPEKKPAENHTSGNRHCDTSAHQSYSEPKQPAMGSQRERIEFRGKWGGGKHNSNEMVCRGCGSANDRYVAVCEVYL